MVTARTNISCINQRHISENNITATTGNATTSGREAAINPQGTFNVQRESASQSEQQHQAILPYSVGALRVEVMSSSPR